jgi:hypothetical protein
MGGSITSAIGKGIGAVTSLGANIYAPNSSLGKAGTGIGDALTGNLGGAKSAFSSIMGGGSGGGGTSAPTVQGKQDPLSMLTMSGGAPLLTNIALGADVGTTLMGYFGASGDYNKWFNGLSSSDQSAIKGLHDQLTQVQTNTDMRNQAVQKLTNDFPNIMASKIPQYSAMADDATKQMMSQALDQISAKQAAGGAFSSGATAAAAAKAGADLGMQKFQYGTGMAMTDFSTQLNQASGLQAFQQKMLGQGATQGFNAVQNALARNAGVNQQQANLQFQADADNQAQSGAMYGALGQLGGTVLGGMFGGPAGAMVGGSLGGSLGGVMSGAPRLNMGGATPNYGGYNRNV